MRALAEFVELTVIDVTTGGVPAGVDVKTWIPSLNYDDTVLIARKGNISDEELEKLPKLEQQVRSNIIFKA